MRIYEGFWDGGHLSVWAMDSTGPALTTSRARVRPHPYAVDHAGLREDLNDSLPDLAVAHAGEAQLWLPGTARHPFPPPELPPLTGTASRGAVRLRQWRVPTLSLAPADARTVLRELGAGSGDLAAGASLRHLASIADIAERLVSTRRVIPQLVEEYVHPDLPPLPAARWRPLLDGHTMAWLRDAARSLPPAARAHLPAEPSAERAAEDVTGIVLEALCALTDHVARVRAAGAEGATSARRTLHHQWLRALTAADGELDISPAQKRTAANLLDTLGTWFHSAHQEPADIRLAFRLVDPDSSTVDDDPDSWPLEFWVQSTEEPSLMVRLSDLWGGALAEWLPRDTETSVLRALGRAARIYPELYEALRQPAPTHLELDLDGAHAFLGTHAASLGDAGFGVLLPPWVGSRRVGLRLHARTASPTSTAAVSSGMGESLVDFDFRAAIGDIELSEEELAELALLKQPLVRIRGEWAQLDPRELRAAADFLAGRDATSTVDTREAVRMAIAAEVDTDAGPLPLTGVDADGDLGELLDGTAAQRITPMEEPPGFDAELRPYQKRGAAWLAFLDRFGLGAILADDMGLGKTVQLLALLVAEREGGTAPPPTLLVCPVSLIGNWHREISRFTPKLDVHVHHGPGRPRGADLVAAAREVDVVLTSYGLALRDVDELCGLDWGRVVCDEAQAIKNPAAQQARAIRSIPAPSRVALTGTPVENHLGELWSIMEFVNPGLLGSRTAFRDGLARAIESGAGGGTPSPDAAEATERLRRVTRPFILRRLKTDASILPDLPEKQEMTAWCTLTREQASLYQATVDEMTALVDDASGIQRKGLVLATMVKLKQVCNHPAHLLGDGSRLDGRSGKLEMLCELLGDMLAEGEKALCFTQYTDFGDRLAPYLAARLGVEVLWLHGGTPRARREEMVARFQGTDAPMVFLLSLRAGGTGLNLTAATQVLHVDRWWNPAVEDQATDRAFRIGQRRDVQVRKMVCVGTVEERIDALMERKRDLADTAIGDGEDWLGELSTSELREVVRLAPEAVEG